MADIIYLEQVKAARKIAADEERWRRMDEALEGYFYRPSYRSYPDGNHRTWRPSLDDLDRGWGQRP